MRAAPGGEIKPVGWRRGEEGNKRVGREKSVQPRRLRSGAKINKFIYIYIFFLYQEKGSGGGREALPLIRRK